MDEWKIKEDHKTIMSAFMADFWKLVKASYEMPEDDEGINHYWATMIKWADALGKKYDSDPVICGMILGYLDGLSVKSNNQKIEVKLIDT